MTRRLVIVVGSVLVVFAVLQVPWFAGARTNPPVVAEPVWDAPATRDLAVRACYDCHSNETVWPWYSRIAPASWLAIRDVNEGRAELNFSEWGVGREQADGAEAAESILEGEMPPRIYLPLHPAARLNDAEMTALAQGLQRTLGGEGEGHGEAEDD